MHPINSDHDSGPSSSPLVKESCTGGALKEICDVAMPVAQPQLGTTRMHLKDMPAYLGDTLG